MINTDEMAMTLQLTYISEQALLNQSFFFQKLTWHGNSEIYRVIQGTNESQNNFETGLI